MVTDCANIVRVQREQRLSLTRRSHELDFECIRSKKLNDCAEIAAPQLGSGNIAGKGHRIKQLVHELPRKRGHEPGEVFASSHQPYRCELTASTGRSNENTTDLEFLPE